MRTRTLGSLPAAKREGPAMTDNVSRLQRNNKVPVVNLPNALTVARVVFVPLFVILALQDSWAMKWAAFVVFAIAAITDRFDGQLARSWNQITDFGRLVDPIADKALTLCGFALLSWQEFVRGGSRSSSPCVSSASPRCALSSFAAESSSRLTRSERSRPSCRSWRWAPS